MSIVLLSLKAPHRIAVFKGSPLSIVLLSLKAPHCTAVLKGFPLYQCYCHTGRIYGAYPLSNCPIAKPGSAVLRSTGCSLNGVEIQLNGSTASQLQILLESFMAPQWPACAAVGLRCSDQELDVDTNCGLPPRIFAPLAKELRCVESSIFRQCWKLEFKFALLNLRLILLG